MILSDLEKLGGLDIMFSSECENYSDKIAHCIFYKDNTVYLLYCNKSIFYKIFYSLS